MVVTALKKNEAGYGSRELQSKSDKVTSEERPTESEGSLHMYSYI